MPHSATAMTNADRLFAQAGALDRRADALAREASDLRREAMELRLDAERIERAPLRVVEAPRDERDAAVLTRVYDVVEARDTVSSRDVAEALGLSVERARIALTRLAELGTVERTGVSRSTRWHVPAPEPDRAGEATLRVQTTTIPERELDDRRVAWTTAEPADHPGVPL